MQTNYKTLYPFCTCNASFLLWSFNNDGLSIRILLFKLNQLSHCLWLTRHYVSIFLCYQHQVTHSLVHLKKTSLVLLHNQPRNWTQVLSLLTSLWEVPSLSLGWHTNNPNRFLRYPRHLAPIKWYLTLLLFYSFYSYDCIREVVIFARKQRKYQQI
jgi:hypothetical protein